MRTRLFGGLAALIALLAASTPASAHHSFAAEYDETKTVTLKGMVTRVDWENPHTHFYIDVKDDNGTVVSWKLEGFPPNMLIRQGWRRDVTVKVGDTITVFGWRARDASNLMQSREITLSDGRKLTSGPPAGTGGN
jgi:hypothetical protein